MPTYVLQIFQKCEYLYFFFYIEAAFRALNSMMFTSGNDRPNVPNIAVFFTDGKATDKKQLFEAANEAKSKG